MAVAAAAAHIKDDLFTTFKGVVMIMGAIMHLPCVCERACE